MSSRAYWAAILLASAMASVACAPQVYHADLRPIRFPARRPVINAMVELCLSEMQRSYQWEGAKGRFFIELGAQLDRNAERLARAAFSEVVVTRAGVCGRAGAPLKLVFRIESTERVPPRGWDAIDTDTKLGISASLTNADGGAVWEKTVVSSGTGEVGGIFSLERRAAEDLGLALGRGLFELFELISESEEIRASVRRSVHSEMPVGRPLTYVITAR